MGEDERHLDRARAEAFGGIADEYHRYRPPSPDALHCDSRPSLRCDELQAMLIYWMSLWVDGFIADRNGAFGWTVPSDEQLDFHSGQSRQLGGFVRQRPNGGG